MFMEGEPVHWLDDQGEIQTGTVLHYGIPSRNPVQRPRVRVESQRGPEFLTELSLLRRPPCLDEKCLLCVHTHREHFDPAGCQAVCVCKGMHYGL